MIDVDYFKSIYNSDIIYHYTKASTAIDYILHNNQLKFNQYKKSNDPIESSYVSRSTYFYGSEVGKPISGKTQKDITELKDHVRYLENNFYQICFCKNHMGDIFANKNCICDFKGHEELFGFTKLRMWDQYADNFLGVCIAFSKERVLSTNKSKLNLLDDDVNYCKFRELSEKKVNDISGNYLANVGKDIYKNELDEKVKQSFFYKHQDYSGENEYRIGAFFDKNNCTLEHQKGELIFDKTMMLDISNCIEAIFMSSYANEKQKSELFEYAEMLNVPIIEMNWKHDSFEPRDYKRWKALLESIYKSHQIS